MQWTFNPTMRNTSIVEQQRTLDRFWIRTKIIARFLILKLEFPQRSITRKNRFRFYYNSLYVHQENQNKITTKTEIGVTWIDWLSTHPHVSCIYFFVLRTTFPTGYGWFLAHERIIEYVIFLKYKFRWVMLMMVQFF